VRTAAVPRQQAGDRAEQDVQVGAEAHPLDVGQVELGVLVHEAEPRLGADLPEPGDARLHGVALVLPRLVEPHDLDQLGARPDEAHVAGEHVGELRQLVEAPAPQQRAEAGVAGVVLPLVADPPLDLDGHLAATAVRVHGPELPDPEHVPVPPDPALAVEDRRPEGDQHGQRHHEEDGHGQDQEHEGGEPVDRGLRPPLVEGGARRAAGRNGRWWDQHRRRCLNRLVLDEPARARCRPLLDRCHTSPARPSP